MCTQWHSAFTNNSTSIHSCSLRHLTLSFSSSLQTEEEESAERAGKLINHHDWLKQSEGKKAKEEEEEEGRKGRRRRRRGVRTHPLLLISTATVFTRSQTSGRRPWRAASPALEEGESESDGKRRMKEERPSITHHPSSFSFFY